MIKINLAKRRLAMMAADSKSANQLSGLLARLNLDRIRELPIQRLAVPLAIGLAASIANETIQEDELKKLEQKDQKVKNDGTALQTKIAGYKTYDVLKKKLDEDETLIKTKLDTIHKLIENRTAPPQLLRGISVAIPKDAWLTELKISEGEIYLRGEAFGFGQISDFMRSLMENPLIGKVELKTSQQVKDKNYGEIAGFELIAKRK